MKATKEPHDISTSPGPVHSVVQGLLSLVGTESSMAMSITQKVAARGSTCKSTCGPLTAVGTGQARDCVPHNITRVPLLCNVRLAKEEVGENSATFPCSKWVKGVSTQLALTSTMRARYSKSID